MLYTPLTMTNTGLHSFRVNPELRKAFDELGYQTLTPVQALSIPPLLEGKDLIGQSQTGSGKTAAFSVPLLQKVDLKSRATQALVLCPTRELATQVAREMRRIGRFLANLKVLVLAGGEPMGGQLRSLLHGAHVVVATPGRLLDHYRRRTVDLSAVLTVVLDEGDRMLELGFREDLETILGATPSERQTILFSATFPTTITNLSRHYQKDPVRVSVEPSRHAIEGIVQSLYEVKKHDKVAALIRVLKAIRPNSAIIFCQTKLGTDEVAAALSNARFPADRLHGDLLQIDRNRILAKFRNGSTRFLVATDVAARGLDVHDLDLVVNFDLPAREEVYIQRIGRTGRAGKSGRAVGFFSAEEHFKVERIEAALGRSLRREALPQAETPLATETTKVQTLFIGGGRKEKIRPTDILGALTGEVGLSGEEVGKIEILDHFTYVAIASPCFEKALNGLRQGRIKGRRFQIERVR